MVVVNGGWMKNVTTYNSLLTAKNDIVLHSEAGMAKVMLICRPNSHHFQERTLILDQPIKIGRSVARAKPTTTNAIFDCKVLSRHHALLWYEDGKFFLQDTKSSNGTFVNNNKLTAEIENYELSSGDIVQFGVDVVENNRKVTHGCIVATIKLYLPDGKEAKASPSIIDSERNGIVPIDDLYKLNQIIQEANRREQCLETKLTALRQIVNDTQKSTDESWQAFVGEERLLSRVSELESQLQQLNKNWSEDRLREEFIKIKEDNETYQVATKETLEKLHAERLQAMNLAMEQERARISVEQEALFIKEQFTQVQLELENVVQKLVEEQKKSEEQKIYLEQQKRELQAKLEVESNKVLNLELILRELKNPSVYDSNLLEDNLQQKPHLIYDNLKYEDDILGENEISNLLLNVSKDDNNISLMNIDESGDTIEQKVEQEDCQKDIFSNSNVDSKTLKYQFQSVQNELKKKIEVLESISNDNKFEIAELERALDEEKLHSHQHSVEKENLKQEFQLIEQKWKDSYQENQVYKNKIKQLMSDLEKSQQELKIVNEGILEKQSIIKQGSLNKSNCIVTFEQLVNLEEELVILKERFAQIGEEKMNLQHELSIMKEKYNIICNQFYNRYFFYIAPIALMIVYMLLSAMIS